MNFHVITLFPDICKAYSDASVLGRAQKTEKGKGAKVRGKKISVEYYDPREHTTDNHRKVDNKPYGGGPGMVMAADMSWRLGNITQADVHDLQKLLQRAQLPCVPPKEMSNQDFIDLMQVDKKVLDGKLRLVLLKTVGEAVVTSDFSADTLHQTLAAGEQLGF
mgnify:CR=1 FL=1